jgi:flagellar hook-associated protein 1
VSIYSILNIANNSLKAAQTSIQVTSNNIANVSTPGYARQMAVLEEAAPIPTDVGLLGDGVTIRTITRYADDYLERSIQKKNTSLQEQQDLTTYLQRIQGFLNEDNSHLSDNITEFFNGWQSLSTDPQNLGMKQTLVSAGQNLAESINMMHTQIKGLQTDINASLEKSIEDINGTLSSIASLNSLMVQAAGTGTQANGYRDQKTALLNELSKKLDIVAFEDKNGETTILTAGGKPLVESGNAWSLTTVTDPTTGYPKVAWKDSAGALTDISDSLGGGSLKAMIDVRDTHAVEFLNDLDQLSRGLIDNVKWTLNGAAQPTSFFQGTGAGDLAVSTAISDDPSLVAASSDPVNNPTDNDVALSMAALYSQKLLDSNSSTFTDFSSSMVSQIGEMTKGAQDASQYNEDTLKVLQQQREAVSGVSLDEEMANLIKYQYAYQASARLFTVADQLLQSLLAVGT